VGQLALAHDRATVSRTTAGDGRRSDSLGSEPVIRDIFTHRAYALANDFVRFPAALRADLGVVAGDENG
jgi:hypothetical protein